ncbi:hypothetical protein TVAG_026660 [Trichomonas vaginalis G3]|uniref:Uncharacterized protein n=1 Tax=Trichomonas vaginalis (strain ATCC PRA-98 / G3) TaxID=412133 RepID=A2DZ69_TRIV3|nr:hypothetical protein TVAGG3_0505180 [Trichomonas vaginalis G3]EAY14345.1 hypothetical protein TVAG_026660 [Trichomonas vaginalis G3]KAI5517370.1 hypothetical protein TVAGG3_0505180 [Trichomonas vaginalis G3]|eukprot:XP_001326568.1 hypothetical protein [Trichomonas vaginalis G3]
MQQNSSTEQKESTNSIYKISKQPIFAPYGFQFDIRSEFFEKFKELGLVFTCTQSCYNEDEILKKIQGLNFPYMKFLNKIFKKDKTLSGSCQLGKYLKENGLDYHDFSEFQTKEEFIRYQEEKLQTEKQQQHAQQGEIENHREEEENKLLRHESCSQGKSHHKSRKHIRHSNQLVQQQHQQFMQYQQFQQMQYLNQMHQMQQLQIQYLNQMIPRPNPLIIYYQPVVYLQYPCYMNQTRLNFAQSIISTLE